MFDFDLKASKIPLSLETSSPFSKNQRNMEEIMGFVKINITTDRDEGGCKLSKLHNG